MGDGFEEIDPSFELELGPVKHSRDDRMTDVCRHFLEGRCTYGAACRFRHIEEEDVIVPFRPAKVSRIFEPVIDGLTSVTAGHSRSVCRHFLQGKCHYGELCAFSHDVDSVVPLVQVLPQVQFAQESPVKQEVLMQPSLVPICRHWQQGRCNFGDACRFQHDGVGGVECELVPVISPPTILTSSFEPKPSLCRHWVEGKCQFGDACRFSHAGAGGFAYHELEPLAPPQVELPVAGKSVCRHWQQGRCDRGDACRFSHEGPGNVQDPLFALVPESPVEQRSKPVCRHFLNGRCSFGDQCGFSHDATVEELSFAPVFDAIPPASEFLLRPPSGGVCRHWLEGRCSYGDACRFPHECTSVQA